MEHMWCCLSMELGRAKTELMPLGPRVAEPSSSDLQKLEEFVFHSFTNEPTMSFLQSFTRQLPHDVAFNVKHTLRAGKVASGRANLASLATYQIPTVSNEPNVRIVPSLQKHAKLSIFSATL